MKFTVPNDLRSILYNLRQLYNQKKENKVVQQNPQRSSFLTLANQLALDDQLDPDKVASDPKYTKIEKEKILLGALVYELETIEAEYENYRPLKPTRSDLYNIIQAKLGITVQTTFKNDERLICLTQFYKYIQAIDPEHVCNAIWKDKSGLLQTIESMLARVYNRQLPNVNQVLATRPTNDAIEGILKLIPAAYKEASAKKSRLSFWGQASDRPYQAFLIDYINKMCKKDFQNEKPAPGDDYEDLTSYMTRMGVLYFVPAAIYQTYRLTSASNSDLYKICLEALNAQSLDEIPADRKIAWLSELTKYLDKVMKHDEASVDKYIADLVTQEEQLKLDEARQQATIETIKQKTREFKQYIVKARKEIIQIHDEAVRNRNEPVGVAGKVKSSFKFVIEKAAEYGITMMAAGVLTKELVATALTGAVVGSGGVVVFTAAGAIIATQLGIVIKNAIVAMMVQKAIEKIGESVANTTIGGFSMVFTGVKSLIQFYNKLEGADKEFFDEWISTLLELPEQIISKNDKSKIRMLFNIKTEADEEKFIQQLSQDEEERILPNEFQLQSLPGSTLVLN